MQENVLIITLPQDSDGGSVVFIEQYAKRYFGDKGIFLLQPVVENGIDKLLLTDRQSGRIYRFEKSESALMNLTKQLDITSIFVNHLFKHDLIFILSWIDNAKMPYTFFIHDYFCVCPCVNLLCAARFCPMNMSNLYCRQCFVNVSLPMITIDNWRMMFNVFLSRADHVYAPSGYAAGIVKKFYPTVDIAIKPHILELPLTKTFHPEFALSRERIRMTFLGNMLRIKGEEYLLLANEFIRANNLPIDLVVVGNYHDEVHVGTRDGIIFSGKYDNRRVSEILAQFETAIVVSMSICYETYCYTASEAILSGYPVLAMNVGAHAARIAKHDCGWLLPNDSPSRGMEELKQFLQFIVTLPGRRQLLQKAKNTVRFKNGME